MPWIRLNGNSMGNGKKEDESTFYCAGCQKKFEHEGEVCYLMYDGSYFCIACTLMGFLDVLDEIKRG